MQPPNRKSVSRPVHQFKLTLGLVLAFAPGAVTAQPVADRSLTVDQKVANSAQPESVLHTDTSATTSSSATAQPAATSKAPENLSSLTREELEARVKSLTESLALAHNESEFFRQQWQDIHLKETALGVDALTVNERKLEDRLVQAVKELYQSEMKRREAAQLLDQLLVTTEQLLKTAPKYDPAVRANYEVVSRSAKDLLAGHPEASVPIGATLDDGQIADVNPNLNSVVINLGKNQGVAEGMPFLVFENGIPVGTVKVVLARELVSAALVVDLQKDITLKVGDHVTVAAKK